MRSNLFIQRQKLKQSTVWETFFVRLFVRHSSKKSASPHPFSVNNCIRQCDRVVLDLLTFLLFLQKFLFCVFFLLRVSEFFVPHFTIYDDVFWTLLLFTSQNIFFVPYWSMSAKKRVFAKNRKQMCEPLLQKWCHIEVLVHNDQKTKKFCKNCKFFAWISYKYSVKKGLSNCQLLQLLLLVKQI